MDAGIKIDAMILMDLPQIKGALSVPILFEFVGVGEAVHWIGWFGRLLSRARDLLLLLSCLA